MFHILIHKGNTNEIIIDTQSYLSQNGYHQENKQQKFWQSCGEKGNPYTYTIGGL
jgi:hypothetical protein